LLQEGLEHYMLTTQTDRQTGGEKMVTLQVSSDNQLLWWDKI